MSELYKNQVEFLSKAMTWAGDAPCLAGYRVGWIALTVDDELFGWLAEVDGEWYFTDDEPDGKP